MKNIKKVEFDCILDNSPLVVSEYVLYNFDSFAKGNLFLSISSKLAKSNKRNYIKRIYRYIWRNFCKKNNLAIIVRISKTANLEYLSYKNLLEESNKIKQLIEYVLRYNLY